MERRLPKPSTYDVPHTDVNNGAPPVKVACPQERCLLKNHPLRPRHRASHAHSHRPPRRYPNRTPPPPSRRPRLARPWSDASIANRSPRDPRQHDHLRVPSQDATYGASPGKAVCPWSGASLNRPPTTIRPRTSTTARYLQRYACPQERCLLKNHPLRPRHRATPFVTSYGDGDLYTQSSPWGRVYSLQPTNRRTYMDATYHATAAFTGASSSPNASASAAL
ncbi:hypothetical protein WOLCODRAFT_159040 [Wolfiporia cocos MD-104 SS10]|uniref:Uncharacterized protein n=1 Tax=Wolfiporia cocos (strain MD-104) TaxID=742152 RepID=A0A2H3JTP0_WOLCO|nr:hypothetical protein WOLCODRAFT_159040 [Wolfiporia cocos MD-104 SS10]